MGSSAIPAELIMVKVQDLRSNVNTYAVRHVQALIGRVSRMADSRVHGALVV